MKFDDQFKKAKCKNPNCGGTFRPIIVEMDSGVHFAKAVCYNCKTFIDWVSKPDRSSNKRPAAHKKLARKRQELLEYCELCLRLGTALPLGQQLEGHHLLDYAHGGDGSILNALVLCSECHSLVTLRQRYAIGDQITVDPETFNLALAQQRAQADAIAESVGGVEIGSQSWWRDKSANANQPPTGELNRPQDVGNVSNGDARDAPF